MKMPSAMIAALSFIVASGIAQAANQPSIGIGAVGPVQAGDQFVVSIMVSDIPASPGLGSWQFDLSFDPTLLSADDVTEGPFLSSFGQTLFTPPVIDDTGGQIIGAADFYVDLPPLPFGSGVIADVDFTALAGGTAELSLADVFLSGDDSGFSMPAGPVAITVAGSGPVPAPEPGSIWLLAFAAPLLAAFCRLNKESFR